MEGSEIPKDMSAVDAVADAVMVAYAQPMKARKYAHYDHGPGDDMEFFLHESTDGKCDSSSIDALYFLMKNYKNLFDEGFLLTNFDFDDTSTIKLKNQIYHTYGVVHGVDGSWYAFSPANHDSRRKKAYALEVIKESSLENVVSQIKKRDGGDWPMATQIRKLLGDDTYMRPWVDEGENRLHVFDIEKQSGKVSGTMATESSNVKVD